MMTFKIVCICLKINIHTTIKACKSVFQITYQKKMGNAHEQAEIKFQRQCKCPLGGLAK